MHTHVLIYCNKFGVAITYSIKLEQAFHSNVYLLSNSPITLPVLLSNLFCLHKSIKYTKYHLNAPLSREQLYIHSSKVQSSNRNLCLQSCHFEQIRCVCVHVASWGQIVYKDLTSKITIKYIENQSSHERIRSILVLVLCFSLPGLVDVLTSFTW